MKIPQNREKFYAQRFPSPPRALFIVTKGGAGVGWGGPNGNQKGYRYPYKETLCGPVKRCL